MLLITECEWCEIQASVMSVVVVGFEEYTHNVCADCVNSTECVSA